MGHSGSHLAGRAGGAAGLLFHHRWGRAVRNPLVDPEGPRPRSSNYAVLLGEGLNTRLYIKNPDSEERHFIAHLFLEDGSEYDLGGRAVEAGSVATIDLGGCGRKRSRTPLGGRFRRGPSAASWSGSLRARPGIWWEER
ncbi:MAG: hypothetical protein ACE5JX_13720 [Acidobacteriota bacterium]